MSRYALMIFFMAVVWRTFWLFVLCLLHRSHYTCGQWSKWHFSYPDLYNVTSMSDVDIERREAEQENRLKVEIRQWYKIEKKPIYPFRTPDKCWHGYDGIDSKLQMELDRICTMQNGGVTSCAQCEANPVRTCRCYNIFQHDYTSNDGGCINNCGQIIPCVGAVVQKEYIHEIKAATLNSLIRKNCVMSSLQKAMDELCGGGLIMRIHSGEYGCYRDDEVSYDIYSVCLDECGINVPCMGYKNGLNPIRTINPMAVDWDRYNRNCVCVERLSSFSKRAYVGCLSKTASGKKCKTWADVDGLMLTRLHGTFIRNYCRELSTSGIQCYNEDNVLEACTTTGKVAGKGPLVEDEPTLFVQPGAFFDIWVKPYIPNYEIKVKFFAPNSVCGEDEIVLPPLSRPFDYQPYDVYTGRWSIHAANQFRNPYPSLREDFESYYIIKGFKALGNAHSKMRMCGCTYSSIYQNQYANNLCTRSAEYIVDLGVIVIMGSPVPEKPIKHSSGMDAVVNVHSVGTAVISMIHMDQLNAILNKDGGSDYMVSIDALFEVEEKNRQYTMDPMYDDNPDYTPYVKTLIPRSTIYTGNTTTLTSVSKPGVYFAIFQETDSEMASRLDYPPRKIVGHHVFIGFEKNLEFKLVGKENETLGSLTQSLFIRSWNITAPPIAIILSKITDGEICSSPFGYSDSIYSVLGNETEEMANLWRIERINVNKERWSEADIFDVCIFRENGSTKKLGSGKKITYVDHELSHLYPGLNEMPNNISTHVVQDEWDIFLIHGNTESDTPFHLPSLYFANNKSQHDLLLKFIENKDCKCSQNRTAEEQYYPQVLSFWCLKESNRVMIFGMTPTRATPTFLGKFIVERPVAFELLVNYESVTALVISEGKSNVLHYKVGMSITSDNMLHFALSLLPSKCPKHRCVKLAAASDMKVINYSLECRQDFMVIVTDAGDNCIILMNSELGETDRICHKPTTIYEHIQEPGKIACTKVPDLPCTSLNANIARQETVNCFITQKRSGVMLWIIVDLRNETMSLEDIYSGELYNPSEEPGTSSPTTAIPLLVYPDSIETVTYDSIDFVYLIESENSVIRTFLIYHRDERKQLVYYGNSKPDNAPYSTYLGIKGIQMSKREENSAVKDDYLLLFRRPESLGFGNQMGGYVTVLNIQETIRVSDFDYTIPHWIIVGTDHYIEPTIKCSTSHFNGLTRYDLEVVSDPWHSNTGSSKCVEMGPPPREPLDALGPAEAPLELVGNAAVRNAISVSHDGKLTISVRDINRITVRIRITAVGPIDAKCIYKTLSLACPDGHFFHNDKVTKKRGCKVCPVGYYNSILLIEKDLIKWGECTQCPENESTIDVGAASPSQCICSPGYYLVNGSKPRCQPCPAGTWKSVVGAQECTGGGCYKNSDSDVIGSTTEEGRKCACRRGYYYRHLAGYAKECVPCEEGYFCPGGFHGKKLPCPVNMTTHIVLPTKDASGQYNMASTVNDCVCKPGFQPAKVERINDITTEEHKLMLEVETELFLHAIENADVSRLICIPCPYNTYKVLKGDSSCIPCPPKTFRDPNNTNDILTCNKCEPGYFETNDPSTPCEECPPNHICVGSDPLDPEMMKYKGKKTMCHKNAITIPPYDKNINMTHCLCIQGFTVSKDLSSNCEAVPKGTYKDVIGNVAPIDCPEGSYTAEPGASSKKDCVCKKGMYFDQTNKRCTICPVGKYCLGGRTKNDEHTPPTDCGDINSVTKEPGASSHTDCLCKPGFYLRHEGQSGCVECPENTFKDHVSNESCTDCDDHSSTNGKIGAISKEHCVCAPGYYFNGTCQACRHPKKYCPGGSTRRDIKTGEIMYETKAPVDCPPNTEIPPGVDTADSVESCKCGKGFALAKNNEVRMIKSCVPCEPGTYKSSVMDSSCNGLCTQNATSKAGAHSPAQCYCQRGYYYLAGGICAPCVEGARCDGGVVEVDEVGADADGNDDQDDDVVVRRTHINPVPIEGYFLDKINQELRKPDDWRFIMCPIKGACLGEKGCSESMTAYLCAECKTGYTNNFKKGTLCTKCPKTMTNVVLTIAWYLGLLLVNIVMACLNVSAGYNRRSIHSVVIKIALNYGICMSVLNVINFGDLALPAELKSYTLRWFKVIHRESSVVHTSIDCLLQHWFGMTHAVSFFYSMLFIACLPVILLVVVTVLMWVILELFKIKRHHVTRSKLALLYQSSLQGMHYLADRLRDEYANERLFLIFRYIPLPGETRWVRFKHFLEDMIPIYVTVLFSVHGNTTSQMLSLLDCTCIHLGQSVPSKYMLRPAMSIRCSLDPGSAYFPYLLLGLGGLIFWGFGIPFFSYIVLLVNRKKLYAPDVRMKYGFLHNGYQQEYWFWEAIVFTRKSLVLVIGSIVIVPSENTSASRMWMALAVAVVFLIIQLIYKPFDERDYFVLGRLESHSMISWTMTLIFSLFAIEGEFSAYNNMYLLSITSIINFCFISEVALELGLAYCDNIRFRKDQCSTSIISKINRSLAAISEKRKSREPLIVFNELNRTIDLCAPKSNQWYVFDERNRRLTYSEKVYFTHIVTEVINFSNIHMKLDIIPTDFPEFITRLAFAVNFHELNKKRADDIVRSLADGNLDEIVNLVMFEARQPKRRLSSLQSFASNINNEDDEHIVPPGLLFDKEVINEGIPLSDFYMALSIIKMKDIYNVVKTYAAFKVLRINADREEVQEQYEKLEQMKDLLRRIRDPDNKTLEEIFCSDEDIEKERRDVEELERKLELLKNDPLGALEEFGDDTFDTQIVQVGFRKNPNIRNYSP